MESQRRRVKDLRKYIDQHDALKCYGYCPNEPSQMTGRFGMALMLQQMRGHLGTDCRSPLSREHVRRAMPRLYSGRSSRSTCARLRKDIRALKKGVHPHTEVEPDDRLALLNYPRRCRRPLMSISDSTNLHLNVHRSQVVTIGCFL